MLVTIAKDKYLVAPLEPGKDLEGGETVEVPTRTGEDWILKGWAVPATPGDERKIL